MGNIHYSQAVGCEKGVEKGDRPSPIRYLHSHAHSKGNETLDYCVLLTAVRHDISMLPAMLSPYAHEGNETSNCTLPTVARDRCDKDGGYCSWRGAVYLQNSCVHQLHSPSKVLHVRFIALYMYSSYAAVACGIRTVIGIRSTKVSRRIIGTDRGR